MDDVIRPAIFDAVPGVLAAFTTRRFAPPSRAEAEQAAADFARRQGFTGTAFTEQIHGADVTLVSEPGHVPRHDGLVTDRPGLLLATVAADCALVLLADPVASVVGTCHAGWRGAVAGIVPRTIKAMHVLGAEPDRMHVYVGPCISREAFEVGEEVAERFSEAHVLRRPEWPRPHVDLRGAVTAQLEAAGVASNHIEVSTACTLRDRDDFYSYRGEAGTQGRMLGLIGLVR